MEVAWSSRQPPSTRLDAVLVRDSKDPAGPVLTVPTTAWSQFLSTGE
ncbi:DUF397 domain-containing protein [Actinophytocola sp.]